MWPWAAVFKTSRCGAQEAPIQQGNGTEAAAAAEMVAVVVATMDIVSTAEIRGFTLF